MAKLNKKNLPSGIITVPSYLTREQYKLIHEQWNKACKENRPIVVSDSVEIKLLSRAARKVPRFKAVIQLRKQLTAE